MLVVPTKRQAKEIEGYHKAFEREEATYCGGRMEHGQVQHGLWLSCYLAPLCDT